LARSALSRLWYISEGTTPEPPAQVSHAGSRSTEPCLEPSSDRGHLGRPEAVHGDELGVLVIHRLDA
jgi:hypothetical protein